MQLTSQQTLPVGLAQAWEALNDITLLQQAIPGCEGIQPTGENQYEVVVMAAIGPVRAKFKGKLQLENLQPPTSYTLRFEGQGGAAGHGKGHADIRLESTGAQTTVLHYSAQASVGGKIAQIGSRLVDMAAQKMAADFFEAFNKALQERYAVVAEPLADMAGDTAGKPGLLGRFMAWLRRLFKA
jgi:carbon monoxide dehydrogenase subunit G